MNDSPDTSTRILIVDDDVGQADMLMEYLHISGFEHVDLVESIRDLWRKLKEKEDAVSAATGDDTEGREAKGRDAKGRDAYEIILLDYMLPDGTGLDVLKQLPERDCQIPVIMVTGQGSERIAAQAIQNGAADYLIKTGGYLMTIPALIKKTLDAQELKLSIQRSLQALRESEARYRAIVEDYQTELICRFKPNGALTFVNEVYCRYFNQPRDELIGMNFLYFVPEAERPKIIQHLASFGPHKHVATLEHRVTLANQEIRWLLRTDRAILDAQDEIFEFQSMGRDITDRKKMENQLQAAQSHLVQAARLATIGEMASGVAHQIYNPLTTIIADAQILLRSIPPDEPARESAQAIEQAGWRLQKVVQRLMEFSRPSSESMTAIPINETIHSALALVSTHLEVSGCRIETQLQQELPAVLGNARQLENLWIYLLLLARDACRDGRGNTIRVHSKAGPGDGGFVVVEIGDNGTPIPQDQLPMIFEPNFVGPTSGRGTGMELSICREIVRQHDGQITADSTTAASDTAGSDTGAVGENLGNMPPVHDTIFRITLPIAVQLQDDQETGEKTAAGGNLPGDFV